jgi:hypothetical protein
MSRRVAPLGTRLVALISQHPGIPPKRMAVILGATRPSVWRALRLLRAAHVLEYNTIDELWSIMPIPASNRGNSNNFPRVLPQALSAHTQHTWINKTNTDDNSRLSCPDVAPK